MEAPAADEEPSPTLGCVGDSHLPNQAASTYDVDIDPAVVAEEEQLAAVNRLESERLQKEMLQRSERELREERYNRLLRLLSHSQFYVQYLSEKIAAEHETSGARTSVVATASSSTSRGAKKPGRKRKREPDAAAASGSGSQDIDSEDTDPSVSQSSQEAPTAAGADQLAQPQLLKSVRLRRYQLDGYNWLRVMYVNAVNCILADEMGLGKTLQAISVIAHLVEQSVRGPFLVVAPLSTLPNWLSELRRFTPQLPTILYHGVDRRQLLTQLSTPSSISVDWQSAPLMVLPVVLTSYEVVMRDAAALAPFPWKYLVVDEAQRLKNHQCRLSGELRRLRVNNRLLLSGTPLQNDLRELWALLNFLLPEIFDDLAVFESWFDVDALGDDGNDAALVEQERESHVLTVLHEILSPFVLRRVKGDVDIDIPPKREVSVLCPMVERQAEMYRAAADRTIAQLVGAKGASTSDQVEVAPGAKRACRSRSDLRFVFSDSGGMNAWVDGVQRLEEDRRRVRQDAENQRPSCSSQSSHVHLPLQSSMMVLRHIANHPFLIEHPIDPITKQLQSVPDVAEHSGKMKMLDAILTRLLKHDSAASKHKVLVFSQFTRMLAILGDFLAVKDYEYVQLDGTCSVQQRQEAIDTFNEDPSVCVFLISTRAGGLGLNLASADTVVVYDSDWNPQRDLQAQDRAHRIGQTRPVLVLRLVTAGTIDERIVSKAAGKRKLEKLVLQPRRFCAANGGRMRRRGAGDRGTEANVEDSGKTSKLAPEELLKMIRSTDQQRVVGSIEGVIDDQQLDRILDRSDLLEQWKNQSSR